MPAKEIPNDSGPLPQGLGYTSFPFPTDDASDTSSASSAPTTMRDSQNPNEGPLDVRASRTVEVDAPPLGAFLPSNLHEDNWLDPMKPHMSPEKP